jgi:glycerate-2-kinase
MKIDIDALEAAARAAKPSPWVADEEGGVSYTNANGIRYQFIPEVDVWEADHAVEDAVFIAAANPAVVLELVRRLKAAEEKLAALHGGAP